MRLARRFVVLPLLAAALIASIGVVGIAALLRSAGRSSHVPGAQLAVVFPLNPDQAVTLLAGLTVVGCTATLLGTMLLRRSLARRLAAFRMPLGSALTAIPDQTGDELDRAASQINELTVAVNALRSKQRSEDEVLAAKRFTDNIIQSMSDVLIVTDPGFQIVAVNKAACALLEYTELELVGRSIVELFKDQTYGMGPPIKEILATNTMRDNEMTYRTRGGQLVSALVSASTMRDNSGRPLAIITVGKDITARKEIERDLLEAKVAAEAASRAKSAFVANMSHEIRTPMTAILGYADLLTRANQTPSEREQCVQTICRNGRHLLSIINDILDVSKIEAGKMTVEKIPCAVTQLVADAATLLAPRAAEKGLAFDVRYAGPVPATIQTDPTRLRQILVNLLGNAIKFTETGGVKLIVSLNDAPETPGSPNLMRFDVIDSGVGLSEQQIQSLFKPFTQADVSTTRKFGGTGLGLTISKRLAVMLGGDLTVHSVPGSGSTFALAVQTGDLRGVSMIESAPVALSMPSAPADDECRLTGRVLLVEDGPDNRVLISFYLRELGLDVSVAENGQAARDGALDALKQGVPFDLILMDMQMPLLDGYQATQELRASGYTQPIVALTAHAMDSDRQKCLNAGCDDFAVKPIEREKLLGVLRKFLRRNESAPTPARLSQSSAGPQSGSQLAALLSKPVTARLVEQFLARLDDRITAIRAAADAQDHVLLKSLAHQLKGAAGGYGFQQISESARTLERSADKNAEAESLLRTVQDLAQSCSAARETAAVANHV